MTLSMTLASFIIIGTPLIANLFDDSKSARNIIIISRILIGLLQGGCYPLLVGLWGKWATKDELSRLISIQFSGSGFGTFIVLPIVAKLTQDYGWESSFYFIGKRSEL